MLYSVDGRAGLPRHRAARRPRHARPRRPVPVLGLVMVAAVAAAGVLWLSGYRTVTLMVDGQLSRHETHAATVGEFLQRAGVSVGPDDRVHPGPGEALRDGMQVEVVHAREVTLLIGDSERQVVASALTVDDLLAELGSSTTHAPAGAARRLVRPSRLSRVQPGMVVELTDPLGLTVAYDGRREEVVTTERTVGALLDRLGISLGPSDRVTPPAAEPLEHGLEVTVERADVAVEVREEAVAHEVVERFNARLPRGERRLVQVGRDGRVEVTEAVVVVDGAERQRTRVGEDLVAEPVEEVVDVGTGAQAPAGGTQVASAGDAEPAAASPGPAEPAAASPGDAGDGGTAEQGAGDGGTAERGAAGEGSVQEGGASWYDNPYGGYTAAHRSLPRGTVVRVVNVANGRSVEVRVNDRGPYVSGRVIDLNRKAFAELAPPSRGLIQVRIEW